MNFPGGLPIYFVIYVFFVVNHPIFIRALGA